MFKKMLAGPMVAGVVLLSTATMVDAGKAQTTPPADEATISDDDDGDDGDSKVGLWGLLGLAGLAGLAGLKRREPDTRYVDRTTTTGAATATRRTGLDDPMT